MSFPTAALAESSLLALWSQAFLRPELGFVERLRDGSYCERLFELFPSDDPAIAPAHDLLREFCDQLARLSAEEARLRMEVTYNKLFVGPGRLLAPPYESYWRSLGKDSRRGTLRGLSELAVKEAYALCGYQLPVGFAEFPDHFAVQLEFLSQLAVQEHLAILSADKDGAARFAHQAMNFIEVHFSYWLKDFATSVEAGDPRGLYAVLTRLICKYFLYEDPTSQKMNRAG
jgi:TorA maturation chaperone TorD